MQLNGSHKLDAPPQLIWELMLNPTVLAKITPGIKSLELINADLYKAVSEVKMGPVNGSFSGTMEVTDKIPHKTFTLKMKQTGKIGNVNAEGRIEMKPLSSSQTEIFFEGEAKLSGTLARTGQRVLSGVANALTQEFFLALENEIRSNQGLKPKKLGFWQRFWMWIMAIFPRKK